MSRARHMTHKKEKHRSDGGMAIETGGNPAIFAMAKDKKSIGNVSGESSKKRLDRKSGGRVHHSEKHREDGGSLKGADQTPYSSAHRRGGKVKEHERASGGKCED